jgi:hypothetical protein
MLTFFTVPKPFEGHIGTIQRNAIESWGRLKPGCEVILFGDEKGTALVAEQCGVLHYPHVERNEYGTPTVDSLFDTARRIAAHSTLCYINADIVLMSDFLTAYEKIKKLPAFLMVGRRWDLDIEESLDFSEPDWEEGFRSRVMETGQLHSPRVNCIHQWA